MSNKTLETFCYQSKIYIIICGNLRNLWENLFNRNRLYPVQINKPFNDLLKIVLI